MKLVVDTAALSDAMAPLHRAGSVALVATMGALHEGHLALISEAKRHADAVVVSIYVNPRQFGVGEDYQHYPRLLAEDQARCAAAGVDLLFAPQTLYPKAGLQVSLVVDPALTGCLCGASRPGHFDGVVTVVAILFHLLRPSVALFGEKDWQQLQVIRAMVHGLCFPLQVVSVGTHREPSGLAMSSRNLNLTPQGVDRAATIYATLSAIQQQVQAGEYRAEALLSAAKSRLMDENITIEYLQIRHERSLELLDQLIAGSRLFIAARIDGVRLIDNVPLGQVGDDYA
ncbi:MAG: pantoate--beta-alanine ligase [Mariprofundales bacterium]